MTKHFKARIEKPTARIHAMNVWFDAKNIVDAATFLVDTFNPIGVDGDQVTQLIEIDSDDEEVKHSEEMDRTRRTGTRPASRMRGDR